MTDMDIKYTEEQQKVIDSNAKRMMVVSCAGSGKSTTIVGRVIRLIGSGVPATQPCPPYSTLPVRGISFPLSRTA